MAEGERGGLAGALVTLLGIVVIIFGLLITYFSLTAEMDVVNPRILAPIGLAVILIGAFMAFTKKT